MPTDSAAERCRDCDAVLTADNVWEPGTCRDCARKLTPDDLHGAKATAASEPMWVGDHPLICDGCSQQIDPGAEGRVIVAGGEGRDLYYHQGCVQP